MLQRLWYLGTACLKLAPALRILSVCISPSTTLSRRSHEEAEGFLSYRIADRRGDHSDHRGYRYSELAQGTHFGERVFRGWLSPHLDHGEHAICGTVSHERLSCCVGKHWSGRR